MEDTWTNHRDRQHQLPESDADGGTEREQAEEERKQTEDERSPEDDTDTWDDLSSRDDGS